MPKDKILTEESRAKLDRIVQDMIKNKESDDNINFVVNDFKSKYSVDQVKKKVTSQEDLWGSNSQPQDLYTSLVTGAQEPQQESDGLGGPPKMKTFTGLTPEEQKTLQAKPAEKVSKSVELINKRLKLQNELSKTKVTPENQAEISRKTDELSSIVKEQDKISKTRLSELEQQFKSSKDENSANAEAEERLNNLITNTGVWNNVKSKSIDFYNNVVDELSALTDEVGIKELKADTDPLSEEKNKVVKDALKKKIRLNDQEIEEAAKNLYKEKQVEFIETDRINSFLDNLDDEDKNLLKQDRYNRSVHLQEDNVKQEKIINAYEVVGNKKIKEYQDIENELLKFKSQNKEIPKDLYDSYINLGFEIKGISNNISKRQKLLQKNKEDLGDVNQEFDFFKRQYGDVENFLLNTGTMARKLAVNTLGGLNYVGSLGGLIGDKNLGVQKDVIRINAEIDDQRDRLRKSVETIESPEGFINYVSDIMSNQIPSLVATSTGAGGIAAIGVSTAGEKYADMNKEVLEGKATYSPLQMASVPFLYGAAEVVSEIPTLSILKKGGRLLESIIKNESDLITKSVKEKAKEWAKDWSVDTGKEIAGEEFTNFAQNFTDKYVLGKKDVGLLDNAGTVLKDTFTLTSILKAAPHVAGAILKPHQSNEDLLILDENSRKIIEFTNQLDSNVLSDKEKAVVTKQMNKLVAKNSEIIANTIDKVDNMPVDVYKKVIELNDKAASIKSEAVTINDGVLPNKNDLLKELSIEYKSVRDQRNALVNAEYKNQSPLQEAFNKLDDSKKIKLKNEASRLLVEDAKQRGLKEFEFNDKTITEKALELFKKEETKLVVPAVKEITPAVEEVEVVKPTEEQILKDISEGNLATFTYKDKSEVPDAFKDKISSEGEVNGEKFVRVTVAKSLADYELSKAEKPAVKEITPAVEEVKPAEEPALGLQPIGGVDSNVNRFETYSGNKFEITLTNVDETGQALPRGEGKKKVMIKTISSDGTVRVNNALTETFETAAEAKEYANKFIAKDTPIEAAPKEEITPAEVKPSGQKVTDIINRPATLESQAGVKLETPIEGDVYQEGQRVIFEDKNKKTYDLGNIDEVSDKTVEELGIKPQEEMVSLTPEGKIKVGGNEWNMQSELPNYGIEYDKDGNIKAVSLKDDAGKTVMYEGQVAEDAAYQVLLKQTETPEQRQAINEILENDEELNRQLREAEKTAETAAAEVTEPGAPKTQAEQYSEELDKTKESDPEAYWSVSPVSAADAAKGTIIDTPDGAAIVKPDGDIAGLFKKATSKAKGVAQDLLKRAVEAGGKKLDNFDTYLTPQYIKAGFRVVSRVPFSLEYGVPPGYNKEKHGTPDVVAMIYDPEGKLDIEEKTFDDYDEAMAYRDSLLEPSIDMELEGLAKLFDESEKGFRMSQVDNAKEALKGILPGVKFIVHETNEAYKNAVGDSSSGTYIMYANGDKVIHINKKNANGRTVAHEVFHAVILDKIKGDKKVQEITARMVDAVYKTASPELRAELDEFAARYSDKSIRDEERLAELIGIIADGYPQMSQINKGIVKRWLDAMAKAFGLKPFTDNEVIDLLNTLARKISTGEVISEEDVAIMSEKEINIPGSQIIGSINIKFRRQAKVSDFDTTPPKVEGVNMIYPSKSDIKDVLEKSGGAAVFINSDGTKVGKVSINGRDIIVQGGIDYTFIKENVDDNIGFAASEDSKISYLKSISDELIKERDAKNPQHKGKPIAVFVVAQNGETMLGEWYAAEYIMEGIDQSISKNEVVLEDIKKDFIDAIESAKLSGNKSGLADRKAKDKVLKMIKEGKFDTQKGRIEIAKEMASKEFSFGFRVNLNKELIAGNEKSWNSGKNRGIKKALSDVGHTMNDFWNKFLDERFLNKLNNTKLQADKGSSISNKTFSGFFYNPSDSLEDQVSHAKLGIDHAQFNSSFKSQENFLLDSAYDVNKLFPNMGYPTQSGIDLYNSKNKTDLNKKNMSIIDKIKVSTWLNKNNSSKLVVNPYSSISLSIYTGTVNEEPQIEEGKTIKKLQQAKSIYDMVRIAKEAKYSDAAISSFLKAKGFSDAQIANALSTDRPSVNKIYEDSKKVIEDKKKRTSIKDLAPFLRKSILDRQAYIKKVINRIDNKSAKKAYDLLVTKAGASALAAERFKRAEKKIYGGLNADDTSTLDKIIYAKRMVSVNESRAKLGLEPYKGMDGYSIDDANKDLADFKNSLGDKKFNDLSNRATEYFDVFKLNLKKLYESGRISKETYESLKDTEYSPIKTIKYIIGDNLSVDEIDTQAKSLGISRNDIMKLSDSNENEIIMDSKWLLAMSINSVEGRAFENNMLREFDKAIKNATPEEKKAFEDIILDNPVVGTKKDGGLKYKYDDTRLPVGFTKVSYFNDGNKVEMILKDQYAKQLLDVKDKNKALETLGKLTGTKILRFFATGGNPLFIIGNTAVDFQNIAFFSDVYSKFKPIATVQLARDYTKNFVKKLVTSNEYNTIFNDYLNHGGALDYMASDGLRSLESMNPVKGVTKAVQKGLIAYGRAMSLLGETSEVAFRLSVFQKVNEDSIKEFKKENNRDPNEQELDDIMWDAARQSRETMPFDQGGDIAKKVDAVFPYFNAALQGIRRPIDFAKRDPVGFSSSVLQYTIMASSLAAGSFAMLISAVGGDDDEEKAKKIMEAMNSLSEYEKANYHIMFTGEKNKDGEYKYYRIKKLPVLSVISTVAEQLIYKAFFKSKGIEYDMDSKVMLEAVSKSNPLPVTVMEVAAKNPVASGLISYAFNTDTFTGDKIFREPENKKILPEAEGMFDDRVDQIYKDLAPGFGLSPARTKVMVEKVITSANTNPTIPLIYSAYDGLFNKNDGLGSEVKEAMSNVGDAFGKKVVRYTDKKIIRYKDQDEREYQESLIETKVWNSEQKVYNEIKKKYDGGGSLTNKELIDLVKENFEPMDYMKYAKKYNTYIHNMNIDKSVLDIIFEDVPEVQAMKLNQRYGPNLESEELKELGKAMNSAGKRVNNKSIYIYNKKYKNRKNAQ